MQKEVWKAHIAIFATNIIFGLNTIFSKVVMNGHISATSLTFFRMGGAALLFWAASLFFKREKVDKKDFIPLFFASLFGILINQFSFIAGISRTSPIQAAIVVTFTPILTMIVSTLYLKEPLTWKKAVGVLMGASGAVMLIVSGNQEVGFSGNNIGNLLCILSGVSYAIYLTVFKRLIQKYTAVTLMKWMFLFATSLSFGFTYTEISSIHLSAIPLDILWRVAYIVVAATFLTYMMIPMAQKVLRPTTLSMYNYMQPLVVSVISLLLGMEVFGKEKILASILVFLGVYIVTQSKSKAQLEKERQERELGKPS